MFLLRKILLQIIVPLTILAVVMLVLLQIIHMSLFNPDWYKAGIQNSGAYEQIAAASRLPDWLQEWLGGNTPQEVIKQQVESTIDSTFVMVKGKEEITVPTALAPVVTTAQHDQYVQSVKTIRTLYQTTRTALLVLYGVVPVLVLILIWLLIKEMVSLLKMLWNILIGAGVVLLLTGGLGSFFKGSIVDRLVPEQWQTLANSDVVVRILEQLVQAVMQVLLIAGTVSVILSLVVWFILRSLQSKSPQSPKEVMAPPLTDDTGVPPTMATGTVKRTSTEV